MEKTAGWRRRYGLAKSLYRNRRKSCLPVRRQEDFSQPPADRRRAVWKAQAAAEKEDISMAEFRPFRAVRPRKDLASRIAALPYDVYSRGEAAAIVKENPWSFLKIDRAEVQLADEVDTYDPQVYRKAAETLEQMIKEGAFLQEDTACLYLYELTMEGRTQTGICGCTAVRDYETGVIRRHENTRKDKEEDRVRHVEACRARPAPFSWPAGMRMEHLPRFRKAKKKAEPLYDFTAPDGVRHRVWRLADGEVIGRICGIFAGTPSLYIADGHHRAASAVRWHRSFAGSRQPPVSIRRKPERPNGFSQWFFPLIS